LLIRAKFGVILVSEAGEELVFFTHLKEFTGFFQNLVVIIGGLVKISVRRIPNS